jgi:CRP-like cAMP-binding protein
MVLRRPSYTGQVLQRFPPFGGLRRRHFDLITRHADQVTLKTGAVWDRCGKIPRELLIIVDGSAQVERDGQVIGGLGAADLFGDLELVDGEQRVETVVATTPVTLLVVEARSLGYLLLAIPKLWTGLLTALRGRLGGRAAVGSGPFPLPHQQPAIQRPQPAAVSEPTSS